MHGRRITVLREHHREGKPRAQAQKRHHQAGTAPQGSNGEHANMVQRDDDRTGIAINGAVHTRKITWDRENNRAGKLQAITGARLCVQQGPEGRDCRLKVFFSWVGQAVT